MKYIKRSFDCIIDIMIASLIAVALNIVIIAPLFLVLRMWMSFDLNYITIAGLSIVTIVATVLYLALIMFIRDKFHKLFNSQ